MFLIVKRQLTRRIREYMHAPLHSLVHPLNSMHKAVKSTQASPVNQSSLSDGFPPLRSRVRGLVSNIARRKSS